MARSVSVQANRDIAAQEITRNHSQDANTYAGDEEDKQGDSSTCELRRNTKCSPLHEHHS